MVCYATTCFVMKSIRHPCFQDEAAGDETCFCRRIHLSMHAQETRMCCSFQFFPVLL